MKNKNSADDAPTLAPMTAGYIEPEDTGRYVITDFEAYYVYDRLMTFYKTFHDIEEYSMLKKKEHNTKFGSNTTSDGNPIFADNLFNDHTVSPADMNFRIQVVDTPDLNKIYNVLLNLTSSHTNVAVPGRQARILVYETTTNKIMGFIRVNSPTLNMKPRGDVFDYKMSDQYDAVNNNMIVGTIIVPTQPFGFNCLGGKLLALIASSNEVRQAFNDMYNPKPVEKRDSLKALLGEAEDEVEEIEGKVDIQYFETTSLYGSIKGVSQYDGLRPYIRNGGMTESALIPLPTNNIVKKFYDMFSRFRHDGELFGITSGSVKMKKLTKIYSLVLNRLKEIDMEKYDALKAKMEEKKNTVTTKKLYYYSTYGVANIKETVIDGLEPKFNIPTERFDMDSMITWWKKKATKRYEKLKASGDLRTEIELWTDENIKNVKHQIIR